MELLNDILNQVSRLSTSALLVVAVIAAGYIAKAIPRFPNGMIPIWTLAVAVAGNVLLGDVGQVDFQCRNPQVRLGLVGVVYWGIGWLLHSQGLKRLEKFLPGPLRNLIGLEDEVDKPPPKSSS